MPIHESFNYAEFHAIDLMDLETDALDPRLAVQPDLKVSVDKKIKIFKRALGLVAKTVRVERLDVLAKEWRDQETE